MHKLIIYADPFRDTEIYEVVPVFKSKKDHVHKISQLSFPQESVEFIKNYANSIKEDVEVEYVGPKDYVQHFVSQANNIEFVKAYNK